MSIGLVFSGGGTCGAYQIGFWRAFRESGMEKNVSAVSGSSVGSLNALLFAGGDPQADPEVSLQEVHHQ